MHDIGKVVIDMRPGDKNPRNSEGAFIDLKDGRIMFVYSRFSGDKPDDDAAADLAVRYSSDRGETWSGEKIIITREEERALNIMSVSLLRMQDGDIGLFYAIRREANDTRLYLRRSADEGETWPQPELCVPPPGYYVVNNDRVVRLSDGRLIVPSAFHRNGYDSLHRNPVVRFDSRGEVIFFISDDDGKTWREGDCKTALPSNMHSRAGLQEPGLVELTNGVLWSWSRTDMYCQYEMFSFDRGETWTPAQPSVFTSPCSPLSMKRIPETGQLLAVWNPVPNYNGRRQSNPAGKWYTDRTPLVLSLSSDDGRTWGELKAIEQDADYGYCYTAIHFIDDAVLLGYCAGGPVDNCILSKLRIKKIKYSEIY